MYQNYYDDDYFNNTGMNSMPLFSTDDLDPRSSYCSNANNIDDLLNTIGDTLQMDMVDQQSIIFYLERISNKCSISGGKI